MTNCRPYLSQFNNLQLAINGYLRSSGGILQMLNPNRSSDFEPLCDILSAGLALV